MSDEATRKPRSFCAFIEVNRMTVRYNLDVSTSRPWTLFKLLFRWRGSVWKSITFELAVWLTLYFSTTVVYRFALNKSQKRNFEQFVYFLDGKLHYIPLDFMLGFFVTSVLSRWNTFFNNIGYIDNIALMVAAYVRGSDEKTRKMRRNIVRYCVLSQALVFRDISMRVRRRFPNLDAITTAGFMMEHEKEKFEEIQYRYAKYWMPFQWALSLCDEARRQQKIASDWLLEKVGEEIKLFRTNMAVLCNYDWVPLPIAYPQLIVLTVHVYFLVCVISRQHILSDDAPNKSKFDMIFPIMTTLQFVFYMGWLKVAEVILNPFGEDDDDFEGNFLLDKNLAIGLTVVDEGYNKTPEVLKDAFWNDTIEPLYSTEAAHMERRMSGVTGSIAHVVLPDSEQQVKMMPLPPPTPKRGSIVAGLFSMRGSISGERILPKFDMATTGAKLSTNLGSRNNWSAGDLTKLDADNERSLAHRRCSLAPRHGSTVDDHPRMHTPHRVIAKCLLMI
ncbi:unnamed protein product [Toxocara canis]|uniref:Bestrophin homolog n=1 Tax=Toxocara canis TaxID=6265 RepID=A0A183URZ7_TOXCA|nr:unnamed protein product [Toxocara canis]